MDLLPELISHAREGVEGSKDILSLIGTQGNPKEVVLGVEEALERLASDAQDEEADDSLAGELVSLIDLYSAGMHFKCCMN